MADEDDQNNVDISVIRKAIEISGNMIEQILKGIHYGSPEVRCLLYSECDYILECKVCRSLFRSLPNFVAHKRAYCKLAYQQSDNYMNLVHPDEETVIVHPEMPEETKKQKQKKSAARSLESTVQQLKDGTLGHSAAYKLYSQAADKLEQQREAAKTQTLTFETIPNTTKAMKVTVTDGIPEPMDTNSSISSGDKEESTSQPKSAPLQSSPTATLKSMLLKSALEGNSPSSATSQQKSPEKMSVKQNPQSVLSPPKKMTLRCKEGIKSMPWKKGHSSNESPKPESHMDFNTLECLDCNSAFRSKKTLIIHYQNAHLGKRTFFPCPLCDHVFFYIFGLTRHLAKAHSKTKQQIDAMRTKLKKNSFVREVTSLCPSAREQIQHVKDADTTQTSGRTRPVKSDIIQTACLDTSKKEQHVCSNCGREFAKKINLLNHRKICLTEGCTPVTHTITKSAGSNANTSIKKSPVETKSSGTYTTKKSTSVAVEQNPTISSKRQAVSQSSKGLPPPIEKVLESASRSLRAGVNVKKQNVGDEEETKESPVSKSEKSNSIVPSNETISQKLKTDPSDTKKPLIKTTKRKQTGFTFSARVKSPPPITHTVVNDPPSTDEGLEKKPRVITTSRFQTSAFSSRVAAPPVDIDELIHSGFSSSRDDSDSSDNEDDIKPDILTVTQTQIDSEYDDTKLPSVKIKSGIVEEIWVDKLPGLPTEKVRSNRTYVMKNIAQQKLECQDMKRLREVVNEQKLQCMHCYQEFSNISNLRRHAIRHLGWKRYKCKMCKFSSYNKSECTTHLVRTHSVRFRNVSSINNLIVDLGKEGSRVRLRKKQQTLFEKQAAECAEAGEDVYVTDQSYKRKSKTRGSEDSKITPPLKKRVRGEKGIDTPFNISTRNSPREFDIRPYKKLDPQSTLCTRKSSYPKKITTNSNFHDESLGEEEDTKSVLSQSSQTSKSSRSDSYFTATQNSQKTKSEISDTDSEASVRSKTKMGVVKSVPSNDSPQTRRSARGINESGDLKAARNLTPDLLD